jgi:small basic protein (TIGR04137 family)
VSIDSSLRRKGRLARSRNVLKREERVAFMKGEDRWVEGQSTAFGIPKTRIVKTTIGKKKKKKTEGEEGDAAAAPAAKGKGAAPAAKAAGAAAPAAKAKGAGKK